MHAGDALMQYCQRMMDTSSRVLVQIQAPAYRGAVGGEGWSLRKRSGGQAVGRPNLGGRL